MRPVRIGEDDPRGCIRIVDARGTVICTFARTLDALEMVQIAVKALNAC